MNKLVKIILLGLAIFLSVVGAGAWYASSLINPAHLSQLIISSVKDATGRNLTISGPVSLKVFPSVAVTADQVSLSNATWASNTDPNMLVVKHLEFEIKLLPLFKKQVEISTINIAGLNLYLQTNKAGQENWDLTLPAAPFTAAANSAINPSASSSEQSLPDQISSIHVTDARVTYKAWGAPTKSISIPKLIYEGREGKSEFDAQADYSGYQFALKGKTGNLRSMFNAWDDKPVKADLDFTLTLNGKTMLIQGSVDKKPKALAKFDVQLSSKSFDFIPLIAGASAAQMGSAKGVSSVASSTRSEGKGGYFFSEEDLPFHLLPVASGKVAFNIGQLKISGFAPLDNFKGDLIFNGDQLSANDFSFEIGKGSAQIQLAVSQFSGPSPSVAAKGLMKGFTLEQISSAVRPGTKVAGGDTQIAFNLRGSGLSAHQLASRANGAVQISVGSSQLDSKFLDSTGDLVITVLNAVNPMRKSTDQTTLECAVAYLPVSNGLVTMNNSIGMVTDRLDIVLSGTVNLSNEALNVLINPTEKSGLTTGVDLAGLVKLGGTLMNPQAGVNKAGVVNSAVSIGLGILTGGATILAENARSLTNRPQPCKAALHSWPDIYPGSN
ncbi:AsmA family protein [Polynucleobacter asymbioticus]|uniref:AsmA family protein n=1 Tax=Polynucleobacter asymbioticus (strain DSM 18221 / CIP 109841 / QLW-P1DMWA-1) TaxID=312153 RepID=A4SWR5_POLAQ|nr:AsmA family protein [Polynucleobacter asymbioticus]ABP33929.1 AsmA family protein [Polynucleobacter asymbioticus QLW-P1DMWA-1]APC05792.1 hypothetical protein AOC10_04205 [Polynucleobacter asymbioticus]